METLSVYIPMDRRHAMAHGQALPDRTHGAALFADISGFTPLTESLVRALGPQRGAEEVTRQLNAVYDALIAAVDHYGGSVIGFSGDAITCWFDQDEGLRATACGLVMQHALSHFSAITTAAGETLTLAMKVAVAVGPLRRFQVGDPYVRRLDTLAGALLDRLTAAEQHAEKGEVVLDAQTAARLGDQIHVSTQRADAGSAFTIVAGLATAVAPAPWPALQPDALSDELVRPWLLPSVYERLRSGQGEFLAELRPAVVLFLRFSGIDYDGDDMAGEKLDAYVRWVQNVLARYEGTLIDLTIGDKGSYFSAAFGAPLAHDDDAARAVAAALELRAMPAELQFMANAQMGISRGRMRTGAYGGATRRTYGVLGDEVNLAARLMERALPGQILVGQRVADETSQRFRYRALGAVKVKGKQDPVPVFELLDRQAGGVEAVRSQRKASSIIGRMQERALLDTQLRRLLHERSSSTVVIEGEAGIGKSRLLEDLLQQARAAGVSVLMGAGDAIEKATPYYAWRSVFNQLFNLHSVAENTEARRTHALAQLAAEPELLRFAPLLNAVLLLDIPDNDFTAQLSGAPRAEHTQNLLIRLLQRRARREPLLLVLEDAHWLDSVSWTLTQRVARDMQSVLQVIATRPSGEPTSGELVNMPGAQRLRLSAMSHADALALVCQRLGVRTLPESVAVLIRDKAEGHPFFSEELAYALRDAGLIRITDGECHVAPHVDLKAVTFPDTVQGVITNRIDQLTPAQQLTLKVASVIGRVFAFRVLREVHPIDADRPQLADYLNTLERLDLTPLETPAPELSYIFKHIITQETAYNLMLFAQRRELHRVVVEWYERTYANELAQFYPLLAYHWTKVVENGPLDAALVMKAVGYLQKAGEQAVASNANQEAVGFYRTALELLAALPETPEHIQQELALQLGLPAPLMALKGYAAPEAEQAFSRARALCQQLGNPPQLVPVLIGLWQYYVVRANIQTAHELARQSSQLSTQQSVHIFRVIAHQQVGITQYILGEFSAAQPVLTEDMSLLTLEERRSSVLVVGQDALLSWCWGSLTEWMLGHPDQAVRQMREVINQVRELAHHHSMVFGLLFLAWLYHFRGAAQAAQENAEAIISLSTEHGFPLWLAAGSILRGWALSRRGQAEAGIAQLQQGLTTYLAIGAELGCPSWYVMLADAHRAAGQTQAGLRALDLALSFAEKNGEHWMDAEIYRLRGELLFTQRAESSDVEAYFTQALDIAHRQQAKSFELRAATSLARLWQQRGKRSEARQLLAPIYDAFTEGFDTADLQAATATLAGV